jgi:iron complex transport system substrate-binding protein
MIDRGYARLVSRLEQNGISVVSLQPATIEKMVTYWSILGALTAQQTRAQKMTAQFKHAVLALKALTNSITAKKKVYFEAIHSKMKTFTPDAMAVFALETAGGINVAQDAKAVRNTNIAAYGKEKILSRGPEIDIFLAQSGAMNRPSIALIKNEPGFQIIKAVANNRIYIIDEQIVSRPTLRLLDGIRTIGRILYPEVFKENADTIVQMAKKF